jgi:tetratricopeptide (TPR) repeat protein
VAEGVVPVFPGARPFRGTESGRFFGRTAEAASLAEEWQRNPLTFLTGPAGIGKTSLLTAGVLPFVESQRSTVSLLPVGRVSGQQDGRFGAGVTGCPVAALRPHNPYSLGLLQSWSGVSIPNQLAGVPVDDFIADYARYHPDVLILAAIDQADDLFAGPEERQPLRRRFLAEVTAALADQPRLRLLVSVRSNCLPRFTDSLSGGKQFVLDPFARREALYAASGPGYFALDAASALIDTLRTSRIVSASGKERVILTDEVEPALLQVVCANLWRSLRSHASRATLRELEQYADAPADAALTGYCSAVIAAVASVHEIPVEWLRTWLIDTFITEIGELDPAAGGKPIASGVQTTVMRALEDRYLLREDVAPAGPGDRFYRLLSDRLFEPLRQTAVLTPDADRNATVQLDPDEHLRQAERARIMGEPELAAKLAAQVLRAVPETDLRRHAEAHSLLGDLSYERGYLVEAEDSYRTAMSLFQACSHDTAVGRLFAAVAKTLIDRGRLNEALRELTAAVNRVPDMTLQDELADVLARLAEQSAQEPPFRPDQA